jgi:hypothetical protein
MNTVSEHIRQHMLQEVVFWHEFAKQDYILARKELEYWQNQKEVGT